MAIVNVIRYGHESVELRMCDLISLSLSDNEVTRKVSLESLKANPDYLFTLLK